jgi:AraC-like DNA-binding protein
MLSQSVQTYPLGDRQLLAPVLSRLLGEASAALDRDTGAVRACLTQAMALLGRETDERRSVTPPRRGGFAPWQEERVKRHIEAHLDQPIRIASLAEISRLSTGYFSVAFRTTFGSSVQTFLAHRRIERAQMLMLSTGQSLTDIALASGFCDQAHFCRRFRRITGQTPNAWRRTYAGAPTVN